MAIVLVKLAGKGIGTGMQSMRQWLDAKQIEPSVFKYQPADAVARIEFRLANDAEAFARAFGGWADLELNPSATAPTPRELTPPSGA
jgi:hypothetical protein